MIVDRSTEFGQRAATRLEQETTGWLTTITEGGQPKSIPVWFVWQEDESVLIYSQPNQLKLRNIEANPRVSFNLDSDGNGGNIVRLEGPAEVPADHPQAIEVPEFVEKYAPLIPALGISAEQMSATYSTAIVIKPERLAGH